MELQQLLAACTSVLGISWFVLFWVLSQKYPFTSVVCLQSLLEGILSPVKSNGGTCREPEFRHSFYEGEEFWQLKAVSFAGKDTGLGFLLPVTLRSHHPEPEELWTLESEDEFAIRLQGRCSGLTALKHWRKGEYRLMLPVVDVASVTEHLVKKYFLPSRLCSWKEMCACIRWMPQITGLIKWAFKDLCRLV